MPNLPHVPALNGGFSEYVDEEAVGDVTTTAAPVFTGLSLSRRIAILDTKIETLQRQIDYLLDRIDDPTRPVP